jgi:hypothetical protein
VPARAGVERADLVEGHLRRRAFAIGGAVDRVVVQQDDGVVGRQLGVDLDPGCALALGLAEACERVLRRRLGRAAMPDDAGDLVGAIRHCRHPKTRHPRPTNVGLRRQGVALG